MSDPANTFEANLACLQRTEPGLAERLRETAPAELAWADSRTGLATAAVTEGGRSLWLASRYDPAKEAQRLVETVDNQQAACVVALGVGLGYHVGRLLKHMGERSLVIVFEPDVAQLRAVLERVDHTDWLGAGQVIFADDRTDRAALMQRLERYAGIVTQGTQLLTHPPSRQRHGEALAEFGRIVVDTLAFCRTTVATTLVNASRTCRNLTANLDYYTAGPTADALHNAAAGYPAVCVSAGPSLARNVDLLRDPAVRRNVVVITAQTTLKPLLDRGIRPDFVTALDYSQICQRFYEDLPALPDVTLVAEPKAHPRIIDSFPGPVRLLDSAFCDRVLQEMARPRIKLPSGATVAHLSFYLAQHLGCDPIVFIGQDLGFSEGLYYAPGTAAHQVWSGELGVFNTLEMMEWQRVVRHRRHLHRAEDVHGQPIYSDEQMLTYLKQFERDFAEAEQTIIDATEGGMPKAHAQTMSLAEVLREYARRPVPALPTTERRLDEGRLDALAGLLQKRMREIEQLKLTSERTLPLLRKMVRDQHDRPKMQKHFAALKKLQARVDGELRTAFTMVDSLNTVGAFKRARADRRIDLGARDDLDRQSRQLERDQENVDWLIQACDEAAAMLGAALERVNQRHVTLDESAPTSSTLS